MVDKDREAILQSLIEKLEGLSDDDRVHLFNESEFKALKELAPYVKDLICLADSARDFRGAWVVFSLLFKIAPYVLGSIAVVVTQWEKIVAFFR